MDFWMDFLVEATKTDVTVVRFPVSGWFFWVFEAFFGKVFRDGLF